MFSNVKHFFSYASPLQKIILKSRIKKKMEDTMENKMREQFIIMVDKISEILNSTDETDSVCEYIF